METKLRKWDKLIRLLKLNFAKSWLCFWFDIVFWLYHITLQWQLYLYVWVFSMNVSLWLISLCVQIIILMLDLLLKRFVLFCHLLCGCFCYNNYVSGLYDHSPMNSLKMYNGSYIYIYSWEFCRKGCCIDIYLQSLLCCDIIIPLLLIVIMKILWIL